MNDPRLKAIVATNVELSRRADVRVTRRLPRKLQRLHEFGLHHRGPSEFRYQAPFWITFRSVPTPERTDAHLPMIHIAFSNLKTWLLGTHHGVSQQHLQAYLNEFVFRFNRRFYPLTAFNSALGLAAHASAPTYEALYSGEWIHPTA